MIQPLAATLFGLLALICLGCSPGPADRPGPPQTAPVINLQPASQDITIGQATTFRVGAVGAEPLTYQWKWNGMAVEGANATTFTTPAAVSSDHQTALTVTVTNPHGTVTSAPAVLAVAGSPRPPKAGDLRFKDVCAFPFPLAPRDYFNINGLYYIAYPNTVGVPLSVGSPGPAVPSGNPINVYWSFDVSILPEGAPRRTTSYQSGRLNELTADLGTLAGPGNMIASLDLCDGQNAYGLSNIQTSAAHGFLPATRRLPVEDLQAAATQEGQLSRVITAVARTAGQALFISYGWQEDTTTLYEARVATATLATIGSEASALAEQGYIITAFGGTSQDGYVLVGTRVQGDTMPRPLAWVTWPHGPSMGRGYAVVGRVYGTSPSDPDKATELRILQQ